MTANDIGDWLKFLHKNSHNCPSERDLVELPSRVALAKIDENLPVALDANYLGLMMRVNDNRRLEVSKRVTEMPKKRLLEEFNAERSEYDPPPTPFTSYYMVSIYIQSMNRLGYRKKSRKSVTETIILSKIVIFCLFFLKISKHL